MTSSPTYDLAGIGIGPFNLSLAAQLDSVPGISALFFERNRRFSWHPGMMLPGVELQTSFLKDLVTATNPTSPWSFVSYLVARKRFYAYLNAGFPAVPREEFAAYLEWVAERLPGLSFGRSIREVSFEDDAFLIRDDTSTTRAGNLALGVGLLPKIPAFAEGHCGTNCFHSSRTAFSLPSGDGRRIAVIGGGQSGAEIVLHLLSQEPLPSELVWISRRQTFEPIDATPFTDEFFTPHYVRRFHGLAPGRKASIVARQKLASDGISVSTLKAIYQRLYALDCRPDFSAALLPDREVLAMERRQDEFRLTLRNGFDGGVELLGADLVVLATGYGFEVPEFLGPLRHRIPLDQDGRFRLAEDFSVTWDGPADRRIFAQNAGRCSHGIAEPQLSLMAWRSSVIVNALLGREHFDLADPASPIAFATGDAARERKAFGLGRTIGEPVV